jgi:monoamine oxidase
LREGIGNFFKDLAKDIEHRVVLNTPVVAIRSFPNDATGSPGKTIAGGGAASVASKPVLQAGFYQSPAGMHPQKNAEIDVMTPQGKKTIHAKTLICTIPPAVLHHQGEDHKIETDFPEEKKQAIADLPAGYMNKIIIRLEEGTLKKLGIEKNAQFSVLNNDFNQNMFFLAHPGGRDAVIGFLGGEKSLEFGKIKNDADRGAAAREYALKYLDIIPEFKDPKFRSNITNVECTAWQNVPYARGAYSRSEVGKHGAREILAKPIDDRVFFAGEASATDGWQTHVYGAWDTGIKAAEAIIKRFKQDRGPPASEKQVA